MAIISVDDLSYRYPDGTLALDGLSLELGHHARLGVVGPSGCGKSTLLSIVAGLAPPTNGEVSVPKAAKSATHPLSMVFQKDTLLPWLTVRDNVGFYFSLHKDKRTRDTNNWIDELLALARLDKVGDRYPYQLSGGMKRRVAFISAVAPKPQVLLLDEPFSSLDEPTRIGIHQDVLRISNEIGMAIILVTHDLAEAVSLSDEVVILTSGPGRVATRHSVPFGHERNVNELRETEEFLKLYGALWHNLSVQITRSQYKAGERSDND
jgi:NitT/TauT family transport system ATP-binding protein